MFRLNYKILLSVVLFLSFGSANANPDLETRCAQLVTTHPDGECRIEWSGNGRVVRLTPDDPNQTMEWGNVALDAQSRRRLNNAVAQRLSNIAKTGANKPAPSRYELRNYIDASSKGTSLFVRMLPDGKRRPLIGTDWNSYGTEMFDSFTSVSHLHASQFSRNGREIAILNDRKLGVWSTQSGKLVRQVVLATPRKSVQSASFSPDSQWIITRLLTTSSESDGKLAVFHAASGAKRFSMLSEENAGFGFSPSNTVFWVGSHLSRSEGEKGFQITFYDLPSGRKLWTCPQSCGAAPLFTPLGEVLIAGATGTEKRRLRTGQVTRNVPGPTKNIVNWALSPDGSQIWSSHLNGQIWSWRVK